MRAIVDIGSNTLKVLVSEIQLGVPKTHFIRSWNVRLADQLKDGGELQPLSLIRCENALRELAQELKKLNTKASCVVGTAALRRCSNPQAVAEMVLKHLKTQLKVISTEEEAKFSRQGAKASLKASNIKLLPFLAIDQGGASTELSVENKSFYYHSFKTGALHSHQKLKLSSEAAIDDQSWQKAQESIAQFFEEKTLNNFAQKIKSTTCVAVGGTLRSCLSLIESNIQKETGLLCSIEDIHKLSEAIRKSNIEERLNMGLAKGRADITPAALLALLHIMKKLKLQKCFVTDWALRHGLSLEAEL